MRMRKCRYWGLMVLLLAAGFLPIALNGSEADSPAPPSVPPATPTNANVDLPSSIGKLSRVAQDLSGIASQLQESAQALDRATAKLATFGTSRVGVGAAGNSTIPAGTRNRPATTRNLPGTTRNLPIRLNPVTPAVAAADSSMIPAQKADQAASKVYFAILANTEAATIGTGMDSNFQFLQSLRDRLFENSKDRLADQPLEIRDDDFTHDNILQKLSDFVSTATATDAIFVHLSSHGSYTGNPTAALSNDNHIFIDRDNQRISRTEILNVMKGKGQLRVLLTDACTSPPARRVGGAAAAPAGTPTYALQYLLFNFTGDVNVSSSSPPEFSWYFYQAPGQPRMTTEQMGGFFTRQFCISSIYYSDPETSGWDGLFQEVSDGTNATPGKRADQIPLVFPTN